MPPPRRQSDASFPLNCNIPPRRIVLVTSQQITKRKTRRFTTEQTRHIYFIGFHKRETLAIRQRARLAWLLPDQSWATMAGWRICFETKKEIMGISTVRRGGYDPISVVSPIPLGDAMQCLRWDQSQSMGSWGSPVRNSVCTRPLPPLAGQATGPADPRIHPYGPPASRPSANSGRGGMGPAAAPEAPEAPLA